MNSLLKPPEMLWRGLNRLRRSLYRKGIIQSRRLDRPVISIGNRSVGGSGKTPLVIRLAKLLTERGYQIVVLTRGYRRKSLESWAIVEGVDATRFGDEPVMINAALPGVDVVVGGDRWRSGSAYLAQNECDGFLLDDGFQHIQLYRDFDIVIDEADGTWYREGPSSLSDADAVLRRGGSKDPGGYQLIVNPVHIEIGGERKELDWLAGRKVVAFSGLGNNGQFFESLEKLGADVVAARGFADHHFYSSQDLASLEEMSVSLEADLVTTEKDRVRIGSGLDIAALAIEAKIESEDELLERLVSVLGRVPER